MSRPYVYRPDKYTISIGVPQAVIDQFGVDFKASVTIEDWVDISTDKPISRFSFSRGVLGEPFLEMSTDSSRVANLSILQTSEQVYLLRTLFQAQLFGIIGFPFSLIDNGIDSNSELPRQKSFYAVSYIIDDPQEVFSLEGAFWVFKIQLVSGATVYV